jgi:hypothetical protein
MPEEDESDDDDDDMPELEGEESATKAGASESKKIEEVE